jgi:hypothetical protein
MSLHTLGGLGFSQQGAQVANVLSLVNNALTKQLREAS